MKLIKVALIGLAGLFALFVFSAIISGILKKVAGDSPAQTVQRVLDEEKRLDAQKRSDDGRGVREKLSHYTQGLQQINYRDCPPDFRQAFQAHTNAWIGLSREMETQPQNFEEGFMLGILNSMSGEEDGGAGRMMAAQNRWLTEIERLSFVITEIAAKHGAQKNTQ